MDPMIVQTFDATIHDTFRVARSLVSNTGLFPAAVKALKHQRRALRVRKRWKEEGLHVPPLVIYSVTKRCNLRCKGCYHHAQHRESCDLSIERIRTLFGEASELGVSVVVLAGGEPLVRRELLDVVVDYPGILFPVFTNGLLIDWGLARRFKENRNIVPIISLEGYQDETDGRRGEGVFAEVMERFRLLDEEDVFFGASVTVTRENFETVTGDEFVSNICERGAQVVVYVEYVPVERGTEQRTLTKLQRERLGERLQELRTGHFAIFITFPGDEENFGGCLAAGRGFLHISQDGSVEPCPASPFSDTNLKESSLREALASEFLEVIRDEPHSLEGSPSGCALFDKEDWVRSLLQS
jgi:MoaA/NifB/PqqE/SkfB family radical SAM enzyme